MNRMQLAVYDFHTKFGATVGNDPGNLADRELRAKLIMEEAVETCAAMGFSVSAIIEDPHRQDLINHQDSYVVGTFHKHFAQSDELEAIDGLCDLLYVIFGSAVAWGIDLEPFFDNVHKANMSKMGGKRREDGKILKPDNWVPPDHERELMRQMETQREWERLEASWSSKESDDHGR